MTKILVSGGRVRIARSAVETVLDRLSCHWARPLIVVHGGAKRTDQFAGAWARDRGHEEVPMPVDSALDGSRDDAPKRRNARMLATHPDIAAVVAFPGGPGTRHMVEIADAKRLRIFDVEIEDPIFRVFLWGLKAQEKATCIVQGSLAQ